LLRRCAAKGTKREDLGLLASENANLPEGCARDLIDRRR
jgi:hypothetical protein